MLIFFFSFVNSCNLLTGSWINELGSVANLKTDSANNIIGTYNSAVGRASGDYELRGRITNGCPSSVVAFSVAWTNANMSAHSTSAWSGVLIDDVIYTTWLLSVAVNSSDDVWAATRVGTNVFQRQK
jgi:hypothetical protein